MNNEYHRQYNLNRYYRLKQVGIQRLGNSCVGCGSTVDLEFDYIDPATKSFDIGSKMLSVSFKSLCVEIDKCQLLCKDCHTTKHATAKNTHGTLSSYRYCKCEECLAANRNYMKRFSRQGNCLDCGVPVKRKGSRCRSCAQGARRQKEKLLA
jgi:hypothetical protein